MRKYERAPIPEFLRIKSVISAFRTSNLRLTENGGEAHSFWEFLYVEKGDISILVDGELFALTPGDLIIYKPNSYHIVAALNSVTINVVCFETDSPAMREFSSNVIRVGGEHHGTIAEIINLAKLTLTTPLRGDFGGMVAREDVPPSTMQKLANKLELLLIDLYESDTARSSFQPHAIHDGRFLALVKYLREHIGEPVTLEEISRDLSMSVTAIQRLCRKECGCGPIDLLISLRIGEAKRLIAERNMNFTQISEHLGFSSVHYFSKLFKRKTGMPPSKYAKSITI